MTDTAPAPSQPVATEIDVGTAAAPPSPMRKVILIALGTLLVLFIYHVLSDRYTPYSSQARVETFLTQIAPEVAGDVEAVGVKDNEAVRKGQLLFRVDPEPYEIAVRSAEANLAVALQGADVSVADIASARAAIIKQQVDLGANRKLGKIITDLVDKKALAVVGENGQAAKGWTLEPAAGLLEECLRSSNFMKLLGEGFAR